ncbi:MAG: hypothetical protein WCK48_03510 [bacterium]
MDLFVKGLREELEKVTGGVKKDSPWGEVNPLVIIGLTEAILDLGLSEDQTYAVIRSYGRQLSAQVHPDRNPTNISAERQRQIIGAFVLLDNRENFSLALADFKNIRAEDRRESKILRMTVSALRLQISGFEAHARAFLENKRKLEEEQAEFERRKQDEPLLVPGLQAELTSLHEMFEAEQEKHEKRVKKLTDERDSFASKNQTIRKSLSTKYKEWKSRLEWKIESMSRRSSLMRRDLRAKIRILEKENALLRKNLSAYKRAEERRLKALSTEEQKKS